MKTIRMKTALLVMGALAWAGSAMAYPTLVIYDGTSTVTVQDGGALDSNPMAGVITWIGTVGVWDINVDTGETKPAIGSASSPIMDLNFDAHSSTAGTLTITMYDTGFTANGEVTDAIGGTAQNTVVDNVLVNGTVVVTTGILGPGAFSTTDLSGSAALTPSDVLGVQVVINNNAKGSTTGDKIVSIPDGGTTAMMLGMALSGLGLVFGRKAHKA